MNAVMGPKIRLRRELVIALLLKFAFIALLWALFFSNPIDEHLNGEQVGDTVFGASGGASPSSQLHINEENKT